jgi:hypothetical protein
LIDKIYQQIDLSLFFRFALFYSLRSAIFGDFEQKPAGVNPYFSNAKPTKNRASSKSDSGKE